MSEVVQDQIRELLAAGLSPTEVAAQVDWSHDTVERLRTRWGGVPPRRRCWSGRYLSDADREEISRGLEAGRTFTKIALAMGRAPSTVSREVNANGGREEYRGWVAANRAAEQAKRPKACKLVENRRLCDVVQGWLTKHWSPEQIAKRLRVEFPNQPEMHVSHETIYQALFVQSRGGLRRELTACLRTGRTLRRPQGRAVRAGSIPDKVMISERPAEVEDRAVPGHWEGDLILGANNQSAIGTLVERYSRYVMLLHLPDGHSAEQVRTAMTAKIQQLPEHLRRSLTWDQGTEMAQHVQFRVETGVDVYFCDPHSPWQRGSNENTNGLLRQYFPKGTDLSVHSPEHLDTVAEELNGRPRKTLAWMTPSERFAQTVATTA